jgi:uncharacterized protein
MLYSFFSKNSNKYRNEIKVSENDFRMQEIIKETPSLKSYIPTFWCRGKFTQLIWLLLREFIYLKSVKYKKIILNRPDGGTVSIAISENNNIDETSPIILFLHSITGSSETINSFVKTSEKRGWRSIVLNRRGHDTLLNSPNFNIMGDIDDTTAMINYVNELYPKSRYVVAVGISAGSGQIVSYIGRESGNVGISAAVSLCPAYDISKSFSNLDLYYPKMANMLLERVKKFFLSNNYDMLSREEGFKEGMESKTLHEFAINVSKMSGAIDWEDYLNQHNPMVHFKENQIPCLILNSLNDPVCIKENIPDLYCTNYALVLTNYGSHIAFTEGLLGEGSYMERVSLDFLESCYKLKFKNSFNQKIRSEIFK